MPRKYVRKPGTRHYADYTPEKLENCLSLILNGTYNITKASEVFSIPRGTIYNRLHAQKFTNKETKTTVVRKYGGQTVFNEEEEKAFVQNITAISDFGFPITKDMLQSIVRDYLQKSGKSVSRFRDNMPGIDWCNGFLKRHPTLSQKMDASLKMNLIINDPEVAQDDSSAIKDGHGNPSKSVTNDSENDDNDDKADRCIVVKTAKINRSRSKKIERKLLRKHRKDRLIF